MKRSALLLLAILVTPAVHAAQWARVIEDQVDFYDGPTKKHRALQKIPRGTMLQASNYPTEGFYKVRLQDGTIGWIKSSVLLLKGTPKGDHAASQGYTAPHEDTQKSPKSKKKAKQGAPDTNEESDFDPPPSNPE